MWRLKASRWRHCSWPYPIYTHISQCSDTSSQPPRLHHRSSLLIPILSLTSELAPRLRRSYTGFSCLSVHLSHWVGNLQFAIVSFVKGQRLNSVEGLRPPEYELGVLPTRSEQLWAVAKRKVQMLLSGVELFYVVHHFSDKIILVLLINSCHIRWKMFHS